MEGFGKGFGKIILKSVQNQQQINTKSMPKSLPDRIRKGISCLILFLSPWAQFLKDFVYHLATKINVGTHVFPITFELAFGNDFQSFLGTIFTYS